MRSSSGCTLTLLINLERCHEVERALQSRIARRLLLPAAVATLRFGSIHLRISSRQQRRLVQMRTFGFVNKRRHSFFGAQLKDLSLLRDRHRDRQIGFYSIGKQPLPSRPNPLPHPHTQHLPSPPSPHQLLHPPTNPS